MESSLQAYLVQSPKSFSRPRPPYDVGRPTVLGALVPLLTLNPYRPYLQELW